MLPGCLQLVPRKFQVPLLLGEVIGSVVGEVGKGAVKPGFNFCREVYRSNKRHTSPVVSTSSCAPVTGRGGRTFTHGQRFRRWPARTPLPSSAPPQPLRG